MSNINQSDFKKSYDFLINQNAKIKEISQEFNKCLNDFNLFFETIENVDELKKIYNDRKDILKKIIELRDELLCFVKNTKSKIDDINLEKNKLYEIFTSTESLLSEFKLKVETLSDENRILKTELETLQNKYNIIKWELNKKDKILNEYSSELEILRGKTNLKQETEEEMNGFSVRRKKINDIKELLKSRGL